MTRIARLTVLSLCVLCSFFSPASAQWKPGGAPVCATVGTRTELVVIPDGTGGLFASWTDTRDAATNLQDIYLQRIDQHGYPIWTINGIAPNPSVLIEALSAIAEDGSGGVYVFWSQGAASNLLDIYGQHYSEFGYTLWAPGGIVVCNAADAQGAVVAVSDGSGGAWLAWQDARYGVSDPDVFINRVDAAGNLNWGTSGQTVCASIGVQQDVRIVGDGLGGCIVAWSDERGATFDVYAQRVDSANFLEWPANGALMTGAGYNQNLEDMAADGLGGAIMVWEHQDPSTALDVVAQRVDGAGSVKWGASGKPISNLLNDQFVPRVAADASGGAVIVWADNSNSSIGVYADYIDAAGATQWSFGGKAIAAFGGGVLASNPAVAVIGDGAVIAWRDDRTGSFRVFAQRLTFDGVEMWAPGGVQVTDGTHGVLGPQALSDQSGGALLAWLDGRNGRNDVFAQRLEPAHGQWGYPEPYVVSANDNPGDQGGYVDLDWWASDRDKQPYTLISYYSTWRATDAPFMTSGTASTTPDKSDGDALKAAVRAAEAAWPGATVVTSPGDIASGFDGEAIWVEQGPQGVPTFWEWMSNQTAYYQVGYSYLAPTRADSSGAGPATHYFKVIAHSWDQFTFWESQYTSGYSVDNLAPGAPLLLVATRVGNYVRLDWNPSGLGEPDLSHYIVYRATSSGVTPVPLFYLDATQETTLWDQNAPAGTPYYYIVTAADIHGNQSLPSNEADVDGVTTGIGDNVPALTALEVLPNAPNPFGDATALRVGLPAAGDVALEVYDVAGRRVYARTYPGVSRGWHDIAFDGRDADGHALAGGVYFYRVHAAGATITRKMVLAR